MRIWSAPAILPTDARGDNDKGHPPHTPAYPGRKNFRSIEADVNAKAITHGFPKMDDSSCCYIDSQSTKDSSGVQLVDLLTGIVSAAWNKSVTSQVKLGFIKEFERKLGIKIDSNSKTRHEDQKYNRWLFKRNPIARRT